MTPYFQNRRRSMPIFVLTVWAQEAGKGPVGGSPAGGIASFFPFIIILVIFYFLLIRPQQKQKKKHKDMLGSLKKGDRVITTGGLMGTVGNIHQDIVTLQMGDNVKLKVRKDYIATLQTTEDEG